MQIDGINEVGTINVYETYRSKKSDQFSYFLPLLGGLFWNISEGSYLSVTVVITKAIVVTRYENVAKIAYFYVYNIYTYVYNPDRRVVCYIYTW